jgi:hypothetical protein
MNLYHEEEKLGEACRRMKASADAMRKAQHDIAVAISDIDVDASMCGQFSPLTDAEAVKLRKEIGAFRKLLNRLEFSSITIQADRLADQAWEKRPI